MTRSLPTAALSVNLLRELADGIERECAEGGIDEGLPSKVDAKPEDGTDAIGSKISAQGFEKRLARRRERPEDGERVEDKKRQPPRPRMGSKKN